MITAVVLAAGLSKRMGTQKMFLPWGDSTVIGKVLSTLMEAGVEDIHVITGATHARLAELLRSTPVTLVFNPAYGNGEMLGSLQVGLRSAGEVTEEALVVLGDQPQIEAVVVRAIIERYQASKHPIIVPSYQMHRGHPWLLGRVFWPDVLALRPPLTLRDFLVEHHAIVDYLVVDTPSVIQDLDTQEDYSKSKP